MDYKRGKNIFDLQSMNRSLILNIIRKYQNVSRAQIAKKTGLKPSTVTNIVNDLIEDTLVVEKGYVDNGVGRKSIQLSLNTQLYRILAVRLTRHHILFGIFDLNLNDYEIIKYRIDLDNDPLAILEELKLKIKATFEKYPNYKYIGIGVSVPGPFIKGEKNLIYLSNFSKWREIDIQEYLQKCFNLPVRMVHDAKAGALCEWWLDTPFLDKGSLIYLAAGQGIGAGLIVDGEVLNGSLGILGEIGHTSINFDGKKCKCGNVGCLETYASTIAILDRKDELLKNGKYKNTLLTLNSNIDDYFNALLSKDRLAERIFKEAVGYLAVGIVNIINSYNPDIIIIGDEYSKASDKLLKLLSPLIKDRVIPEVFEKTQIRISKFKMDSALIGAAAYFLDNTVN